MAEGISPNPLNKISQVYLDRIAKINSDPEIAQKEREKWQTEAKVDTGSAEEKATARNKRNTPAGKDYKFDTSVFITRKPGESLDSARTRKRRDAHAAKRGVKENFSSWRTDLREIVDEIESNAEKKVEEKKGIKNKVIINPKLSETVEKMGGQLLEVAEVEDQEDDKDAQKAEALKKKEAMLKKRIVRMKMQAVNQGAGETVIASYDPLENAVEYFYEEGINEEGIDILIEEIGLDDFVDFVDGGGAIDLNEERAARKASVKAKKYDVVKKEVDKADAARKASKKGEYAPSYAKKETDVTVYDDKPAAKKKAPAKKPAAKKIVKPVAKKVERAVTKVKKSQPKKEVSKKGIRGAIERGVARHKKAVGDAKAAYKKQRAKGKVPEKRAREFASGVKSGVKTAVKFAKDVKKVVGEEVMDEANKAERVAASAGKRASKKSRTTAWLAANVGKRNINRFGDGKERKLNKFGSDYQRDSVSKDGLSSTSSDHAQQQRRDEHEKRRGVKTKGVKEEVVLEKKKQPSVHDDYYDPMEDPTFDPHEAEATRGQSGRGTKGKMNVRKKYKVKEGKIADALKKTIADMKAADRKAGLLPGGKDVVDLDVERQRRRKNVEEEVGISSTEKMAAARKEAKLRAKEAAAVKKAKTDKQKAAARKKAVSAKKQLSSTELAKYDTDNDGKVRVVNASFSNWKKELIEKDLNAAERRALPDKEFALPGKGKGPEGKQAGSYPIPDKSHARMALAMVAKHGTPEKKEKVRAAVAKKFPGIQQEAIETQAKDRKKLSQPHSVSGSRRDHSHDVDSALTDHVPRKGKGRIRPASKKEMRTSAMRDAGVQQEGLVGAKVDSQKEVNRATRKAAFRPFKNTTPPKLKVAEDKAFDNVVGALRKKHGKDAVLTKDSPKPKAQPRPKAKPDTRTPEQKKKDQDHANVMARYGGEANYKAGRGLGT